MNATTTPSRVTHYQVPGRFGSVQYVPVAALLDIIRDSDGRPVEYAFHVSNMNAAWFDADEVEPVDMTTDVV